MPQRKLKRILHIDDEPSISAVVAYALRKLGHYEVRSANSGYQAVELAKEFRPDLILLDVMMPGMDGIQTLVELHADQASVIVL